MCFTTINIIIPLILNIIVTSLRAVSDDLHVYRHFQKRQKISSSYNEFRTECKEHRLMNGDFELPSLFTAREPSSIKATKRKMYQLRYEKLTAIAAQIQTGLELISARR